MTSSAVSAGDSTEKTRLRISNASARLWDRGDPHGMVPVRKVGAGESSTANSLTVFLVFR
jgi:hypothetical protein